MLSSIYDKKQWISGSTEWYFTFYPRSSRHKISSNCIFSIKKRINLQGDTVSSKQFWDLKKENTPWKINGWFTYKPPMKRKENHLNQTSRELCSMFISRDVNFPVSPSFPLKNPSLLPNRPSLPPTLAQASCCVASKNRSKSVKRVLQIAQKRGISRCQWHTYTRPPRQQNQFQEKVSINSSLRSLATQPLTSTFLSTVYVYHHNFLKLSNFDFALFLFKDIQQHPECSDCP